MTIMHQSFINIVITICARVKKEQADPNQNLYIMTWLHEYFYFVNFKWMLTIWETFNLGFTHFEFKHHVQINDAVQIKYSKNA